MAVSISMEYIPFAFPGLPGIRCAFTTRHTGTLSLTGKRGDEWRGVVGTRLALLKTLGVSRWTELKQVHGDTFYTDVAATPIDEAPRIEADGAATGEAGHALCVKTADCQPLLLAHPEGCVAAVHVGWRGNALGFPHTAVTKFCSHYGLDPAEVHAVRGPSLGHAEFVNFSREWPTGFAPWYDQATRCMDLWGLTRRQLSEAGLQPRNIHSLDLCTYSLNQAFFSHRRGDGGRQAGIIWKA